jgi:hypothetical protein
MKPGGGRRVTRTRRQVNPRSAPAYAARRGFAAGGDDLIDVAVGQRQRCERASPYDGGSDNRARITAEEGAEALQVRRLALA